MKINAFWLLTLLGAGVSWYFYQKQQAAITALQSAATSQPATYAAAPYYSGSDYEGLTYQDPHSGLGLTVSGSNIASGLINSLGNLFSSAPSSSSDYNSAYSDLGVTADYSTQSNY